MEHIQEFTFCFNFSYYLYLNLTEFFSVCPLQLLREIETKVWLLAVESETQVKSEGDFNFTFSTRESGIKNDPSIIDRTASIIAKMDNHINTMRSRIVEKYESRENNQIPHKNQVMDAGLSTTFGGNTKTKRRAKGYMAPRRPPLESADKSADTDDGSSTNSLKNEFQLQEENVKVEMSFSRWEERVGAAELERAVLSLLEFGQIAAAKQLQYKFSPGQIPSEFRLVDAALKLAAISTPPSNVSVPMLDEEVRSVMHSYGIMNDKHYVDPLQVIFHWTPLPAVIASSVSLLMIMCINTILLTCNARFWRVW